MSVAFTITGGAYTDVSFSSLGLSALQRELKSQGNDRATFDHDGASFDTAALFAYGSTATIKRAGVKWFVGRVVEVPRFCGPKGESIRYELAGPWWYLENLVYQQNWKVPVTPTNPASSLTDELRSSLILNLKEDNTTLTTRQQIKAVVDYAIACGAPIAIDDTTFPALNVSWEEGKDMTCAEVIRRQLRWAPDACLWWDYTAGTPTLKCAQRAGATAASFAVDGTDAPVQLVSLRDRPDLQVPVVALKYESPNQQDQISWTSTSTDKYPLAASEAQFGALIMTIQLGGSITSFQRQKLKTRVVDATNGTSALAIAWWKKHLPWLTDSTISGIAIGAAWGMEDGSSIGAKTNELVEGSIPAWKETSAGRAKATALIDYTITGTDGSISKVKDQPVSVTFIATSLSSTNETTFATYSQTTFIQTGETAPTGLAQALYNALSALQYEGKLVTEDEDVASSVRPGLVLRLTGGMAAWATMDAQIQSIVEDVDSGHTEINFGPAQQLGPQDLIELLRPNRTRNKATAAAARTTGVAQTGGVSDGGTSHAASQHGSSAAGPFSKLHIVDHADTSKQMQLDPSALATGEVVALRTVKVWDDVANTCKTMKVLGTVPV